jgi:hypothetical protein
MASNHNSANKNVINSLLNQYNNLSRHATNDKSIVELAVISNQIANYYYTANDYCTAIEWYKKDYQFSQSANNAAIHILELQLIPCRRIAECYLNLKESSLAVEFINNHRELISCCTNYYSKNQRNKNSITELELSEQNQQNYVTLGNIYQSLVEESKSFGAKNESLCLAYAAYRNSLLSCAEMRGSENYCTALGDAHINVAGILIDALQVDQSLIKTNKRRESFKLISAENNRNQSKESMRKFTEDYFSIELLNDAELSRLISTRASSAEKYLLEAVRIGKFNKNSIVLDRAYSNLSSLYWLTNQSELAMQQCNAAIELAQRHHNIEAEWEGYHSAITNALRSKFIAIAMEYCQQLQSSTRRSRQFKEKFEEDAKEIISLAEEIQSKQLELEALQLELEEINSNNLLSLSLQCLKRQSVYSSLASCCVELSECLPSIDYLSDAVRYRRSAIKDLKNLPQNNFNMHRNLYLAFCVDLIKLVEKLEEDQINSSAEAQLLEMSINRVIQLNKTVNNEAANVIALDLLADCYDLQDAAVEKVISTRLTALQAITHSNNLLPLQLLIYDKLIIESKQAKQHSQKHSEQLAVVVDKLQALFDTKQTQHIHKELEEIRALTNNSAAYSLENTENKLQEIRESYSLPQQQQATASIVRPNNKHRNAEDPLVCSKRQRAESAESRENRLEIHVEAELFNYSPTASSTSVELLEFAIQSYREVTGKNIIIAEISVENCSSPSSLHNHQLLSTINKLFNNPHTVPVLSAHILYYAMSELGAIYSCYCRKFNTPTNPTLQQLLQPNQLIQHVFLSAAAAISSEDLLAFLPCLTVAQDLVSLVLENVLTDECAEQLANSLDLATEEAMKCSTFAPHIAQNKLLPAVNPLVNLVELNLSNNPLCSQQAWSILLYSIAKLTQLKSLDLSHNNINPANLTSISDLLHSCTNLTQLNLSYTNILIYRQQPINDSSGSIVWPAIDSNLLLFFNSLRNLFALKVFDLSGLNLNNNDLYHLLHYLIIQHNNPNLLTLSLSKNDEGQQRTAQIIHRLQTLRPALNMKFLDNSIVMK